MTLPKDVVSKLILQIPCGLGKSIIGALLSRLLLAINYCTKVVHVFLNAQLKQRHHDSYSWEHNSSLIPTDMKSNILCVTQDELKHVPTEIIEEAYCISDEFEQLLLRTKAMTMFYVTESLV